MKLGLQHIAVSLVIGVIAGLFLSPFIGLPLNPTKEVTSTVTDTTTITSTTSIAKTLALWPYSLSFRQSGVGPYGWGYDLTINPDGSATVNYHREKSGSANLTISKAELDGISFLLLKANFLHLNNSYAVKQGYFDWGFYDLTLTTYNETKSVSWAAGESAVESTPKDLHEIENYLGEIAYKVIPK